MCVWSTGIGPTPLVTALCKKIAGQRNTRAITTDDYLVVKGAPNIYAIGDCSTVIIAALVITWIALTHYAYCNRS
jgi:NADH dehydrogenase FAD-containing subunit